MAYRTTRRRRKGGCSRFFLVVIFAAVAAFVYLDVTGSRSGQETDTGVRLIEGKNIVAVEVDPERVVIRPALALDGLDHGESFHDMIDRLKPLAAINGTFYDKSMKPLGDILIEGNLVCRGAYPNALGITGKGKVAIIRRSGRRFDWSGYRNAIAAGPRLVYNGKIALDPRRDGFSSSSLNITAWRSGVGITKSGKLMLVSTTQSLTLERFARKMIDLGCVEAMNLDGGGATSIHYDGDTIITPTLPMTNILAVYKREDSR